MTLVTLWALRDRVLRRVPLRRRMR
jgi:hypothetical protein